MKRSRFNEEQIIGILKKQEAGMTPAKLRLVQAAMEKPETVVAELCSEIGITRQTLYRFVDPKGQSRAEGERLLGQKRKAV